MKFETVGQFLVALEEGQLFDENNMKYVLNMNNAVHGLVVERYDERGAYCGFNTLLSIHKVGLAHTFTRQTPGLEDKGLVWCWGGDMVAKEVHFYDKENDSVFGPFGERNYGEFTNYEVIPKNEETGLWGAPFEWANEAVKKLED